MEVEVFLPSLLWCDRAWPELSILSKYLSNICWVSLGSGRVYILWSGVHFYVLGTLYFPTEALCETCANSDLTWKQKVSSKANTDKSLFWKILNFKQNILVITIFPFSKIGGKSLKKLLLIRCTAIKKCPFKNTAHYTQLGITTI